MIKILESLDGKAIVNEDNISEFQNDILEYIDEILELLVALKTNVKNSPETLNLNRVLSYMMNTQEVISEIQKN